MLKLPTKVAKYFPYSTVRPFQDEFANTTYEAVQSGNHVLLKGSNGLGKTVAALSACLPVARGPRWTHSQRANTLLRLSTKLIDS